MGGARVLLVDADLRKGSLHNRFNIEAETGLSEVLSQGTDWRSVVKETAVANLWLLPRGATTQRSSEFFIGPVMEKFLQETNKEYDYVLIDTAPVMAADDVTSLAPRVDGVIFVIRAEFTSARVARAALDMLYQRKSRVLGLVFNSVRATGSDYYSYYRYRDYYKAKAGQVSHLHSRFSLPHTFVAENENPTPPVRAGTAHCGFASSRSPNTSTSPRRISGWPARSRCSCRASVSSAPRGRERPG